MKVTVMNLLWFAFFATATGATGTLPTSAKINSTFAITTPCKRGTKIGQILVQQPNMSSIFLVGSKVLIQWSYTQLVTKFPKVSINSTVLFFCVHKY
jgi:hypothetical protein